MRSSTTHSMSSATDTRDRFSGRVGQAVLQPDPRYSNPTVSVPNIGIQIADQVRLVNVGLVQQSSTFRLSK
jgi:hypothetical protein